MITTSLNTDLAAAIAAVAPDRLFLLTDTETHRLCLPLVADYPCLHAATEITIPNGDTAKTLHSTAIVWEALQRGGATRHSLLICLGGGMVTDLGGFAAATFKRGIACINIPTTLLAMVDASAGGKTGVNYGGLKNEIGVFATPRTVLISTQFLRTLDSENLRSGYAEMLKHALICHDGGAMFREHIAYDIAHPESDLHSLAHMINESVHVKQHIVDKDPHEQGLRKALNLGHTAGHAFESWAMKHDQPVLHGYAVAYGLVVELFLSCAKTGFPITAMRTAVRYIRDTYGTLPITCDDYPELLALMRHDKKNTAGTINFTLLAALGDLRLNTIATDEEITEALDFFREG